MTISTSSDALPGFGPTRSFRAATMRDTFAQVKALIGPDAIILQTRDHGVNADPTVRFEVLAAYPSAAGLPPIGAPAPSAPPPAPSAPPPAYSTAAPNPAARVHDHAAADRTNLDEAALVRQLRLLEQAVKALESQLGQVTTRAAPKPPPEILDPPVARLVAGGVDKATAELLVSRAVRRATPRHGLAVARPPDLADELGRTIRAATPIWSEARGAVAAFVGPAGAGKTSALLKIAGRARFEHRRSVAIVSTDLDRLGTFEQLQMYADVMGIPLLPARDRQALDAALEQFADDDLVLVDTPGTNPFDDEARIRVMKVIGAREVRQHLVLPATLAPALLADLIQAYAGPALASLIVTRVDEARGVGPVIACCAHGEVPVSHLCDGREIPDDVRAVDALALTQAVLARAS